MSMFGKRTGVGIGAACIVFFLGVASFSFPPTDASASPLPGVGCGGVCLPCGFWWYAGEPIEPDGNYSHAHPYCDLTGQNCSCSSAFFDPEATERAAALVATGTIEAIRAALHDHPEVVVVNTERSAVQVVGCNGSIVVHAPLPSAVIAGLAEVATLVD